MTSFEEFLKKPVYYHVSGMEHVTVKKDFVYQTVNNQSYHFDVYSPVDRSERKTPTVVLVHGDAPMNNIKDIGQYVSLGSIIAATGMAAVTFNHRTILTGASISDVCNDIKELIIYIRNNSNELNIDAKNIAVWSFSGGVPFGLKVCSDLNGTYIKSIVTYYGPTDFGSLSKILNIEFDIKQMPEFSIIDSWPNEINSLFVARAGLDSPIINDSMDQFINKALSHKLNITMCNHATGQHAFDILDDTARTREIIGMTLHFLAKNLLMDPN